MSEQLRPGDELFPNQKITSGNGEYFLILQLDGNLVLQAGEQVIWAANTNGQEVEKAIMNRNGLLQLLGPGGNVVWQKGSESYPLSHLILQDDRNLVLYYPVWATGTEIRENK